MKSKAETNSNVRIACLTLSIVLTLVAFASPLAQAQTFSVLHSFAGTDGAAPWGRIVLDSAGRLTGTTTSGGNLNCPIDGGGCGTVFRLAPSGTETVLYDFQANGDGQSPTGGVTADSAGNVYGTSALGGAAGFGSVFEIKANGAFVVLYSFTFGNDGALPQSSLVRDAAGNLYGTAESGGANGFGTVFKIDPQGNETTLYSFTRGSDGGVPGAGLLRDAAGNLYGTTVEGGELTCGFNGFGCGVVFRLDTAGALHVLHTFLGGKDGSAPTTDLTLGADGSLYGTTFDGGGGKCTNGPYDKGCGVIFKIARNGSYKVLYRFTGGSDGAFPGAALVHDAGGNLFGTATNGGPACSFGLGCGTIFELTPTGTFTVLHGFTDIPDGEFPHGLTISTKGVLYGTAAGGGSGDGVVFKLIP